MFSLILDKVDFWDNHDLNQKKLKYFKFFNFEGIQYYFENIENSYQKNLFISLQKVLLKTIFNYGCTKT